MEGTETDWERIKRHLGKPALLENTVSVGAYSIGFSANLSEILGTDDRVEAYISKDGKHLGFKAGMKADKFAYQLQRHGRSSLITLKQYQHRLPMGRYEASVDQNDQMLIIGPAPRERIRAAQNKARQKRSK